MNHYENAANFTENLAVKILNEWGIECKRNNVTDITAVDIITTTGLKIDVQYSADFSAYGDFRLDIVSAFFPPSINKNRYYIYNKNCGILDNFCNKYGCQIVKSGKIMQSGYLDLFFILFYKNKFAEYAPDWILLASSKDIVQYVRPRVEYLFEHIKINAKSNLDDRHGSAFIPINVKALQKSSECLFGTLRELSDNRSLIHEYLERAGDGKR